MQNTLNLPPFLTGDSEIATLMRTMDWSRCPIGSPDNWPQALNSKLNTIMGSAFPMFLFWGDELVCFYNDAFRPSLGVDGKHPGIGKTAREVWSDIWDFIGPLIDQVMTTGKPVWFEDQYVPFYRNGRIEDIYWTFSYSAVTDDSNKISGVVVVCTETTEKVNLFKKLEESNNLYSFAIDASELGTWDLDPKTNKFVANNRLKEWFGLDPEDEIDLSVAIGSMAASDRERVTTTIAKALDYTTGGYYDVEYTISNAKTGQERIVRAKGKATFNELNEAIRFNGTLQDITAEVIAREDARKLSILVENSVDLMAILKLDGKNAYINKAGKELLGIDASADITEIPIADFHTPEQLAFVMSEIIPSVMSTGKWSGEFAIRNGKTGEIIPLYNNCHRIDNPKTGEPIGIGTVMRDIRAELDARNNLEKQVKERTIELLKLNEELKRKNKDLASFAFVSSHDLQEPLRKINTFISRIEEEEMDDLNENNKLYFGKIKGSVKRMQTLISDLLDYSRANTDQEQSEEVNLNDIVNDICKELAYKFEHTDAKLDLNILPTINGIAFQIRQLFANLITNSLKFSRSGHSLQIGIESEIVTAESDSFIPDSGEFHRISVIDNGIGFQSAYNEKIFEVFQRLHSRDAYEGTGIGLSICKKIMENHQGFIRAEGFENKGATFHLYFPTQNG
ncbi:MAG TPA: ATP-binding protein [Daejeonella sp.]